MNFKCKFGRIRAILSVLLCAGGGGCVDWAEAQEFHA